MAQGWLIKDGTDLTVLGRSGAEMDYAIGSHTAGDRNRERASGLDDGMYRIDFPDRKRLWFVVGKPVTLASEIARLTKRVAKGRPVEWRHGAPGIAGNQESEARVNRMLDGAYRMACEQLDNLKKRVT